MSIKFLGFRGKKVVATIPGTRKKEIVAAVINFAASAKNVLVMQQKKNAVINIFCYPICK